MIPQQLNVTLTLDDQSIRAQRSLGDAAVRGIEPYAYLGNTNFTWRLCGLWSYHCIYNNRLQRTTGVASD